MRILGMVCLLVALPLLATAQSLDGWHGLKLGKATPDETLGTFPAPKSDRSGESFRPLKYDEWFVKAKDFRVLHYENIEGFSDVKLYFREGALAVIHLEPKDVRASAVQQAYGVEFDVLVSGMDLSRSPGSIENERGKNYPKKFPVTYWLMHKAENSTMFVFVENGGLKSILGGGGDMNSFPGKARQIQLISDSIRTRPEILK